MVKKNILLFIALLFSSLSFAQIDKTASQMAIDFYRDGEIALLDKKFKQARRLFQKSLKSNPKFTPAHRGLGLCLEQDYKFEEALFHYEQIIKEDSLFSRALYYEMGEISYKLGKAEKALTYFEKYESLQAVDFERFGFNGKSELSIEKDFLRKLPGNIKACQISLDSAKFVNITTIVNLGPNINTKAIEYFPFLSNNQHLIFFNRRKDVDDDEDLFYSKYIEGAWEKGTAVRKFNSSKNEGMASLVRNGQKMYFTACGREGVLGTCDIWEAEIDGYSIESVSALSGFANSEKWESEATVSCDGTTLFFASTRAGGFGGTDLWYSQKQATGLWARPKNMGPKINTPLDEESPFITNDGKTLYFASTGHLGIGEQDIFVSWFDERTEEWSIPINIGPPVNSPFRELGFFLSADGKTGYFASDRPGGYGGMDIYKFELNETLFGDPITFVEGYVRDSVSSKPLIATVKINGRKDIKTEKDGRFFLCVGADEILDISIKHKDYLPLHSQFPIPEWDNRQFYAVDLLLQKEGIIERPIPIPIDTIPPSEIGKNEVTYTQTVYFQFDQSQLNPNELNKLADFVDGMKKKDIQKIEIIGYADDIGNDLYNFELSEDRAKTIALFLINNDLIVDQIYMEGRGEIKDSSPKIKNRRVDLKVMVLE